MIHQALARALLWLGAAVALLSPWGALAQPQSGVYREAYYNITGSTIASLTNASVYPNTPSYDEVITTYFEAPQNVAESFGQRISALLTAPASGSYIFWIASDDNGCRSITRDMVGNSCELIVAPSRVLSAGRWQRMGSNHLNCRRLDLNVRNHGWHCGSTDVDNLRIDQRELAE